MSREQMEAMIKTVYAGDHFAEKLKKMSDKQVYTMYMRMMNAGKFKEKK